ncbi:MAG TPA: VWA domain-containing protein [Candidatus Dormibacteraeota bacterium]|nr:VWA domain-containing protein [Candidatus Dormibacteraeota bacterium]
MLMKVPLTRIRISYFLFIALLITAAASARQNAAQMPPQAQQNSTPTQAHSNKMYLDVVVSQKSGSPVAGLQQQDFTLLDNKSPQTITSFKEIAGRQAPINVVLVIDAVNVDARTIAYEREQIGKFLSSEGGQLAYPTVLSVFTETGIQISGDFTNDGNALKSELDSDKIGLRPVGGAAGFYGATERLQLSLTALRQFTAREGVRPGRNVMIWISPGWPILSGPNVELDSKQKQQIFTDIVDMSNRLAQARVTLYEVNPLGASESQFRGSYYEVFLKPVTKPDQVNLGNLALQVLSIQSGGRAFDFNNDIPGLLQKCFTDIAPYYEISFVPAAPERPGEYHSLEVKVSKSGLTARTHRGYYVQPAQHD